MAQSSASLAPAALAAPGNDPRLISQRKRPWSAWC